MPPTLAHQQHSERARGHYTVGVALQEAATDEWAAVAYFYSAYHHVKCAMLQDPVWDDPTKLHLKHRDLIHGDKFVERHKGRKQSPRSWGINELVLLLYPSVVREYELLHQASIQVRYGTGLPEGALPDLRRAAETIRDQVESGSLKAS